MTKRILICPDCKQFKLPHMVQEGRARCRQCHIAHDAQLRKIRPLPKTKIIKISNETKKCSKCNQKKPLHDFTFRLYRNNKRVLNPRCRTCLNEEGRRIYQRNRKNYQIENEQWLLEQEKQKEIERQCCYRCKEIKTPELTVHNARICKKCVRERNRQCQLVNKETYRYNETLREQKFEKEKREKIITKEIRLCPKCNENKTWEHFTFRFQKCKECQNKRNKELYLFNKENDKSYLIGKNIRSRIAKSLKAQNRKKEWPSSILVGCSFKAYKTHLESLFTQDMSWDNYGKYGWHIDHIIPLDFFDLEDFEQQKIAFHYLNTEPRWATTKIAKTHGEFNRIGNINKGNRIVID